MSVNVSDFTMQYLRSDEKNLKNVNLKVKKGERVGILGPTGSGKSSLFMSLNGTIPHFLKGKVSGKIIVDGIETLDSTTQELARHVGVVYADPSLSTAALAVEDDVAFGPQCLGWKTEKIQRSVKDAIKATRLSGFELRSTSTLSGGELQAVNVASILAMQTPILALDEPLTMLDPIGKQLIIEIVRRASTEGGRTTLVSEAGGDIEYFTSLVDRIVVLYNGEVIADDSTHNILTNYKLMDKIGVEPPQVTRLAHLLEGPRPYPINLKKAIPYFRKLLKKMQIKKTARVKKAVRKKRTEKPIVSVRNLHHVFPGLHPVHALKGISFDIYPKEIIGLIGQNGSGKTTLSLHLVGIQSPTDAEGRDRIPDDCTILVSGADITELKRRKVFKFFDLLSNVNYAFQNPDNQLFEETIELEVGYGPKQLGLSEKEIKKRVDDALNLYGIADRREDPVMYLTKDMKTYTATASIVALYPTVLIIDEPTTGLDFRSSHRVMEAIKELKRRGHTIIIITHDMRLVAEYADRLIVMGKGEIHLEGPPHEVFAKTELLAKVFVQPPQITMLGQELSDFGLPPGITTVKEMHQLIRKISKK